MNERYQPKGLTPRQIISTYDSAQWEEFIEEWSHSMKPPYVDVIRYSGSGDKGRDVAGYYGQSNTSCDWDNYQCKHYDKPLAPSNVWIELGKLTYYTFIGDYSIPKKYRFVAPKEVGPRLKDILQKPAELRKQLIENWERCCEKGITDVQSIPLVNGLKKHVELFDYSIVGYIPIKEILEQHRKTRFWADRFKLDPPPRPASILPPLQPEQYEMRYIQQLLEAYGEVESKNFDNANDANIPDRYKNHLSRSRVDFFRAESLNRFSRDHFPAGAFESIKNQVYDGVVDTVEREFADGYKRVCATTDKAASLPLTGSDIAPYAEVGDKKGICHHLANEDKLNWVRK